MDADRILVMEGGYAAEYGHPYILLNDQNGHFRKMVKETGPGMEAALHEIARLTYEKNLEIISPAVLLAQKDIEEMSTENTSDSSDI